LVVYTGFLSFIDKFLFFMVKRKVENQAGFLSQFDVAVLFSL
jgi:hypothetical protein